MSDSIQEQIVKKIATAFAGITVANGYANTVQSVQRHNQSGIDLAVVPTILVAQGDSIVEIEKSPYPWVRRSMTVNATVAIQQDETATSTDTRSGDEQLNSFLADMEKRLAASGNWDGLAIETTAPHHLETMIEAEEPHLGRTLTFDVRFQHIRTDPYSQTP